MSYDAVGTSADLEAKLREYRDTKAKLATNKSDTSKIDAAIAQAEALQASYTSGNDYDRSKFINTIGAGTGVETAGKPDNLKNREIVRLPENLLNKYRAHLIKICDRITSTRIPDKTTGMLGSLEDTVLAKRNTELAAMRWLYERITHSDTGEVSLNKLNDLLKTEEGILLVQEIVDENIRMGMFGMGLFISSANNGYERDKRITGQTLTDIDLGKINKILRNIGGAFQSGKFIGLFRSGIALDREACAEALDSIKKSPSRGVYAEYLRTVMGISVSDFVVYGDKITQLKTESDDPSMLVDELVGLVEARMQFYTSIGVDPLDVDAILEEGIMMRDNKVKSGGMFSNWYEPLGATLLGKNFQSAKNQEAFEQTRGKAKSKILDIYRTKIAVESAPGKRLAMAAGNERQMRVIRLDLLAQARHEYMNSLVNEIMSIEDRKTKEEYQRKIEASIDQKIQDITVGKAAEGETSAARDGKLIEKDKQAIQKQIDTLTADKQVIAGSASGGGLKGELSKAQDADAETRKKQTEIDAKIKALGLDKDLVGTTNKEKEQDALTKLRRMVSEAHGQGKAILNSDTLLINGMPAGKDSFEHQKVEVEIKRDEDIGAEEVKIATQKENVRNAERAKLTADRPLSECKTRLESLRDKTYVVAKTLGDLAAGLKVAQTGGDPAIIAQQQALYDETYAELVTLNRNLGTLQREYETTNTNLIDAENILETEKSKLNAVQAPIDANIKRIKDGAENSIIQIEANKTATSAEITTLEGLIAARDTAEKDAEEKKKNDPGIKAAEQVQSELVRWFDQLTKYNDGTASTPTKIVTEVDLCDKPIEEIMELVNKAHAVTPKPLENQSAWPKEENDVPERRRQVLMAKLEAQARRLVGTSTPTSEQRISAMDQYIEELSVKKIGLEAQKGKVGEKYKDEREKLTLAKELVERKTKIGGSTEVAQSVFKQALESSVFAEESDSCAIPFITENEKACVELGGYLVILNALTGYQEIGDLAKRQEAFDKWKKIFPPEFIAEKIAQFLKLPNSSANPANNTGRDTIFRNMSEATKHSIPAIPARPGVIAVPAIRYIGGETIEFKRVIIDMMDEQIEAASAIS